MVGFLLRFSLLLPLSLLVLARFEDGPRNLYDLHYCKGKVDGFHPNLHADPPLSSYIYCKRGRVVYEKKCREGTFFWEKFRTCSPIRFLKKSKFSYAISQLEAELRSEVGYESEYVANAETEVVFDSESEPSFSFVHPSHPLGGPQIAKESFFLKRHNALNSIGSLTPSKLSARTDAEALLAFKDELLNVGQDFNSWSLSTSVCKWEYVTCTKQRRVGSLILRNLQFQGTFSPSLANLTELHTLIITRMKDLSPDFIPSSDPIIPAEYGNLLKLKSLELSGYELTGEIPSSLGNCVELTSLKLNNNKLVGNVPSELQNLVKLQVLDLSDNFLSGSILPMLITFKGIVEVKLGSNTFSGPLPAELGNLAKLRVLDLSDNDFEGSIPPPLGDCTTIVELRMPGNLLMGEIPSELGKLSSLKALELAENYLTGEIPKSLGNCKELIELRLSGNNLTGEIPSELGNCKDLEILMVHNNSLTGEIPESAMANWKSMTFFDIGSNFFKKAPFSSLVTFEQLFILDLSANGFTGKIPSELGSLSMFLSNLDLSNNSFTGGIPAEVANLTYLETFSVANNKLTGIIPPEIPQNLFQLFLFAASNNSLSGSIPAEFGLLPYLSDFLLDGNNFTGSLHSKLFDSPYLKILRLNNNSLSGTIPKSLWQSKAIDTIELQHNNLIGEISLGYYDLDLLSLLNVKGNHLQGNLSFPINCTALLQLILSDNKFTGGIPSEISRCRNLQNMDLSGNPIGGSIPSSISALTPVMEYLTLRNTSIKGEIPPDIGGCQLLKSMDLSHNRLSGVIPNTIWNLTVLRSISLNNNLLNGSIPSVLGNLSLLESIHLQKNNLSGEIPGKLSTLSNLNSLDLSNNQLSGSIPYGFTTLTELIEFNVSDNQLSGSIPSGELSQFPASSFSGNTGLCGSPLQACPVEKKQKSNVPVILGSAIGGAVFAIAAIVIITFIMRRYRSATAGQMLVFEKLNFPLTIQAIHKVTDNFSEKYKLGKGGFGTVYKAKLQDERIVAIKRLADASTQGEREFRAEMSTLGAIRHRNLVTLIASYLSTRDKECLLIYNFLPGGSLDGYFYKEMSKSNPFHCWSKRLQVAIGTARGMKYLHHDCNPPIIHRDMKPGNILLDEDLVAHVADFGLAREMEAGATHMSTDVFGTIGYLAPEYTQKGRLTEKSDVFAFGVVLLQLVTGRQPTDEEVGDSGGLARWAGGSVAEKVVDPKMEIDGPMEQVLAALKVGLLCTSRNPEERPSMAEVLHLLENLEKFAAGISVQLKKQGD